MSSLTMRTVVVLCVYVGNNGTIVEEQWERSGVATITVSIVVLCSAADVKSATTSKTL